jgi:hypothetical protein
MKYTFSFKEINFGSIEIESKHKPDRSEVIDAIMSGNACFSDTEYEDIQLIETERKKPERDRSYER